MSGGTFNYQQNVLLDIADTLSQEIKANDGCYKPETIDAFRLGVELIEMAYIYAQRIDWLLSGDDGEDDFHERLKDELKEHSGKAVDLLLPDKTR
jgi:hypothetical protein